MTITKHITLNQRYEALIKMADENHKALQFLINKHKLYPLNKYNIFFLKMRNDLVKRCL